MDGCNFETAFWSLVPAGQWTPLTQACVKALGRGLGGAWLAMEQTSTIWELTIHCIYAKLETVCATKLRRVLATCRPNLAVLLPSIVRHSALHNVRNVESKISISPLDCDLFRPVTGRIHAPNTESVCRNVALPF